MISYRIQWYINGAWRTFTKLQCCSSKRAEAIAKSVSKDVCKETEVRLHKEHTTGYAVYYLNGVEVTEPAYRKSEGMARLSSSLRKGMKQLAKEQLESLAEHCAIASLDLGFRSIVRGSCTNCGYNPMDCYCSVSDRGQ